MVTNRNQPQASKPRSRVLAKETLTDPWRPDGFEVKISGGLGSRKVWIHTVVEAAASAGRRMTVQSHTTIAHVRDF